MAAVQEGMLADYALHRPGAPDGVGDLYRGRLTARMPAMAGAFVTLGRGPDGFLPDSAGGSGATSGSVIAVRITRAAQGGKGPRLRHDPGSPCPPGHPGLLEAGPCAVLRLAALHPAGVIAVDDAALLSSLRPALGARLRLVARAFDENVQAAVEALGERTCRLPGGGSMTVEPTAALVAIDVDLGALSGGRGGKTAAHQSANAVAIPQIARQIRLRNLSGPIVVDLAGLSARRRAVLGPAFAEAVARDPLAPRFLGFSALGLAEILRPRVHPPLHELLGTAHAAGLAGLRAVARTVAASPSRAPQLWCAPDVADAVAGDQAARGDLARRCGRPLEMHVARDLPPRTWRLEGP